MSLFTGAAAIAAALAAAGGTAVAGKFASKGNTKGAQISSDAALRAAQIQADSARETARLQTEAATKAAQLQKESSDAALGFTKQQALYGAQSAETDRSANYQQWAAKERRLGSIGEMVGLGQRDIPSYVPSPTPNFDTPGSGGAAAGGGPSQAAQYLKGLLDTGKDPQAAIADTNAKFGLSPDKQNSAMYYDPSQHGGVATIGLPDSYLALKDGKWEMTVRNGSAAPAAAAKTTTPYRSVGDYLISPSAPTSAAVQLAPALARPAPYRSVGSYL